MPASPQAPNSLREFPGSLLASVRRKEDGAVLAEVRLHSQNLCLPHPSGSRGPRSLQNPQCTSIISIELININCLKITPGVKVFKFSK